MRGIHVERRAIVWLIFVVGIALIPHSALLNIGYFADDVDFVTRARQSSYHELFAHALYAKQIGGSWRPLTELILTIPMRAMPHAPFQHACALALYAALCILFFIFLRTLMPHAPQWVSASVALTAVLVPVHVEPVAWVATADVLALCFGLGATIAWARGYSWPAVGLYAAALLSKEIWLLLPLALFFIRKPTARVATAYGVVAVAWYSVRQHLTGFGVGGYALPDPLSVNIFERIIRAGASFMGGGFLFGTAQSVAASFGRAHAILFILCGAAILVFMWMREKKIRPLLALWCAIFIPTTLLDVPVLFGVESVAEHRYWFVPAALLCAAVLFFFYTHVRRELFTLCTAAISALFFAGTLHTIHTFKNAALYRDGLIAEWVEKTNGHKNPTVVLLPDTWHGVHLFAEPFFSETLALRGLPVHPRVIPLYQTCGDVCAQEIQTTVHEGVVFIVAPTNQMFFVGEKPRLSETTLPLPSDGLFLWTGAHWEFIAGNQKNGEKPM